MVRVLEDTVTEDKVIEVREAWAPGPGSLAEAVFRPLVSVGGEYE